MLIDEASVLEQIGNDANLQFVDKSTQLPSCRPPCSSHQPPNRPLSVVDSLLVLREHNARHAQASADHRTVPWIHINPYQGFPLHTHTLAKRAWRDQILSQSSRPVAVTPHHYLFPIKHFHNGPLKQRPCRQPTVASPQFSTLLRGQISSFAKTTWRHSMIFRPRWTICSTPCRSSSHPKVSDDGFGRC